MKYDINGEPEFIQTRRGPRPNPNYQPGATSNQPAQETGLSDLLKDLGSNSTSSDSITLTSGKDDGAVDVTRKNTINAASPTLDNTAKGVEQARVYMPGQEQMAMLNEQYGDDFTKGEVLDNLNSSMMYNSPYNDYQPEPQTQGGWVWNPQTQTYTDPNTGAQYDKNGAPMVVTQTTPGIAAGTQDVVTTVPNTNVEAPGITTDANSTGLGGDPMGLPTRQIGTSYSGGATQDPNLVDIATNGIGTSYSGGPLQTTAVGFPEAPVSQDQGPQTYTVDIGSEDDLALQNDPSFDETDNEDGTITYTSNDPFSGGHSAPGTGNSFDPQVTEEVVPTSTIQGPSGAVINPDTGEVEAVPLDVSVTAPPTGAGTSTFDEPLGTSYTGGPTQDPSYFDKVNSDDPLETADALEELAITEFEDANSNINTPEDASANLDQVIDEKSLGGSEVDIEETLAAKDEIDQAAETGDKGLMGDLMDSFKGVFKDGELTKALLLYAGSRIAGFSHSGSAKFAYEATDILGSEKSEYDLSSDQLDKAVENGILTPEEAQIKKKQLLLGDNDSKEFSASPQTMLDEDGNLATRDKKGKWWYRNGTQVPHNIKLRPQPSANNLITLTKPQRERMDDNDKAISSNTTALSVLNDADIDSWHSGFTGKGLSWFRGQLGMENDQDFANMFTTNASNATALRNRAPGAMTEREWDILLGATPGKFSDPKYIKKYFEVSTKVMKLENERLSIMNSYLDYGLTHSEARDKSNGYMNKKYPPAEPSSSTGGTGNAGDGSTITSDYL